MKKFYVCKGGLAKGPFTVEKLIENGINPSDPVWCAGFKGCKPARNVAELKMIFDDHSGGTSAVPGSAHQQDYILYKRELHRYRNLLAGSLVAVGGLVIYYLLTVLIS